MSNINGDTSGFTDSRNNAGCQHPGRNEAHHPDEVQSAVLSLSKDGGWPLARCLKPGLIRLCYRVIHSKKSGMRLIARWSRLKEKPLGEIPYCEIRTSFTRDMSYSRKNIGDNMR